MPKRTEDEIRHWLWFEALRLSDDYKKVCEWVENSSGPVEKLDWSQHPHIKETYLERMGDVFLQPFDDWWQQKKLLGDVVEKIFTRIKVRPLDLCEAINEGLELLKDDFDNDFDSAKDNLLAWTKERYQQPKNLIVILNTELIENAKEASPEIGRLIVQHRGKNKPSNRLMAKEIGLYLNVYRKAKDLEPITGDGWPAKTEGYLEDSDRLRMIRKAKKIIDNATRGEVLGEY